MWTSPLLRKSFWLLAGLNLALVLGVWLVVVRWQREQNLTQLEEQLHSAAVLVRTQVEQRLADAALNSIARQGDAGGGSAMPRDLQDEVTRLNEQTGLRVTLLNASGGVLADSDSQADRMENHGDRPEIAQAAEAGYGVDRRQSLTLGAPMVYAAVPVRRDGKPVAFVRLAADTQAIESSLDRTQTILLIFASAVLLASLAAAYWLTARTQRAAGALKTSAEAVAAGDFSRRVAIGGRDELAALAGAFNRMQQEMASQVGDLRASSSRLATVLGSMVEGVLAVGPDERILFANDAGRRLLGFVTPDVVGRPLREVTRNRAVHDAVSEAFRSPEPIETELEVPAAARNILALRAVRLPGEPCPGVVAVLHDVTELRRLENLRREFVANVSHELKTPLASIKAYAETLRMGAVNNPENNLNFIGRIEEQAERLHQLILDLISLARVESGQEAFEIADVSLGALIDGCLPPHQKAAASKNIALEVVAPPATVLARADEDGIRTIIDNLVTNAVKYTPEGGRVWVRWSRDDSMAVLEVQDNGIGISQRDQTRVFERFYRVDRARSRELGGTGLGLSIVKHLAQAFGGSVSLTSKLGEGSSFQVRLPLA